MDNYNEELGFENSPSSSISDILFATALQKCDSVLLKKGQTPALKIKKKEAAMEIADFILLEKGIKITEQQILKKINNMKTRVKTKTDAKVTGNKKCSLNAGEQILFNLIGAEENPTIRKLDYGISVGAGNETVENSVQNVSSQSENVLTLVSAQRTPTVSKRKIEEEEVVNKENLPPDSRSRNFPASSKKQKLIQTAFCNETNNKERTETPATAQLTTAELQRLVLNRQLEVFKKQEEVLRLQKLYYEQKLKEKPTQDKEAL